MATQAEPGPAPSPRPTGTVTFLFSDIEGSTAHWEEQRAAMPAVLRRHDELIRNAIEANSGYVFKTVGDELCAAFWRAPDALAAAADAQRALAAEDWSAVGGLAVRMALHSGTTDEREGDYFGPTVNRVARLLAVAHGGQVVVSGLTAQLLHGTMPEQMELRDLGEHGLKDLVEPERVWQLIASGLPDTFPPLASLASLPNNLPRQVTPLIGRDDILAEIEPLVLEHPLVTLVGTGGVGKTRLALQAGADLLDGSADGVWFVELAPLSDAAAVAHTVTSTFGLREQANRSMLDVLAQYLRHRRLLLILDNCEHLVEEAARVADAIVRAAPQVRILATSRESLRIAAEHVYRVPSLDLPSGDSLTSREALQYGAIALFAERASAADAKFALTDEAAPIVAEICRRLDGIALAIELAAAWVKAMAPRELAQKLDERFRMLTGGSRTALPRQQTMRALIDWSYDLLAEREQLLFRRLAIFVGGWTIGAAETVCADETLDALDVIDLLSSLVEKSLVVAEVGQDSTRYRLLESTRAFALEKLEQSGEHDALACRHMQWASDLYVRATEIQWSATLTQRFEFVRDFENARAAMEWALSHDEVISAARIVVGFTNSYRAIAGEAEVRSLLEAVLARLDPTTQPALAARAWDKLSQVTSGSRSIEAEQRAVELAEWCNDPKIATLSLCQLAFRLAVTRQGQDARMPIDRAMRLLEASGLTHSSIHLEALANKAVVAEVCGSLDEARQSYAEALSLATELGNETYPTTIRLNMAELELKMGNPARALELVGEVDVDIRLPRANLSAVTVLQNGAGYRIALGDIAGARTSARDALQLARGVFTLSFICSIQHLATVAARSGDARRGARLRGYVDAWFRSERHEREPTEQLTYEILMTALREQLTDAEIEALAAEGAQMTEDQAVAEALTV
jgi:predicted ATPase/class 3 adenylate cyclase